MTVEETMRILSGFDPKAEVLRATQVRPLMVTTVKSIESMDSYSPEKGEKTRCPIII